jgi:hypothetical protein
MPSIPFLANHPVTQSLAGIAGICRQISDGNADDGESSR